MLHEAQRPSQVNLIKLKDPSEDASGQSRLSLKSKDVKVSEVRNKVFLDLGVTQIGSGNNDDGVLSFMFRGNADTTGLVLCQCWTFTNGWKQQT